MTVPPDSHPALPRLVLVVDEVGPGGGPGGYTYVLLEGLRQATGSGLSVTLIGDTQEARVNGTRAGDWGRRLQPYVSSPGVALLYATRRHIKRLRSRWDGPERSLRATSGPGDLVVLQGFQDPSRLRAARANGATVAYMPHSPVPFGEECSAVGYPPGEVRSLLRLEGQLINEADLILMPCSEAGEHYYSSFALRPDDPRMRWVGSATVRSSARREPRRSQRPVVMFAGRYVGHKGYDLFVQAAEDLARSGVGADFASLGAGPERVTSTAVADLGWSDAPHGLLSTADVVVVPNRSAYFDLLPLEAASMGIGLVLSDVGGNSAQSRMLPDSVLCSVDDISGGIRDALQRLRDDSHWGRANITAYNDHFTPVTLADKWIAMMKTAHPS